MTAAKGGFDAVSEAWIAEQLAHFTPNSMHEAVRVWRAFERSDAEQHSTDGAA